ncbi:hypothetical protein [Herbiconiux sp. L3-i23]|uniref:hypothetical protein n=1 Tax=Herbiconiux sp. L3-i23 TaxID=2905871 RepID=UPI00204CF17C|nr:hypothetical protein [Herbiconiux sp. L3-i23]BDI21662.1 hypothetical protein L3i23_04380 [Herbiconiux sp. L3-i23]
MRALSFQTADLVDLGPLEEMPSLQSLDLNALGDTRIKSKIDASGLTHLEQFIGDPRKLVGIDQLSEIRRALVLRGVARRDYEWPLQELELRRTADITDLARFVRADDLRKLAVTGVKNIDVSELPSSIRALSLTNVRHITGVTGLANIEHLVLEDCPAIDSWEKLFDGRCARITSIGRRPFEGERSWVRDKMPPPTSGTSGSLMVLLHPGVSRPLSYPDTILDSGVDDLVDDGWDDLDQGERDLRMGRLLDRLNAAVMKLGTSELVPINGRARNLEAGMLSQAWQSGALVGGEKVLLRGRPVAEVLEDPWEGIIVDETVAAEIRTKESS